MALSRDEVVAAIARRRKKVEALPVPEWEGDVYVRLLSAQELKEAGFFGDSDAADLPVRIMALALCDAEAAPLFDEEGAKALADADFTTTVRIFEAASKVNGLGESDVERAAQAFVEAQPGGSSSS